MGLSEFVDEVRSRKKTLTVFTATEDEQLLDELERFFGVQNVTVRRGRVDPDGPQDFVVLHQAGEAVAVSTLGDVRESLFLGEAGSRSSGDVSPSGRETPDVIRSLGNTTFAADGEDRLLLKQISHHILELAFGTGTGVLHAGVGKVSELLSGPVDYRTYARLADEGVEVHLYGTSDAEVPADGPTVHTPDAEEVATTRFLVFDAGSDDGRKAAMVACDPENGTYRGFWTFETDLVDDVLDYLNSEYGD